MRETDLSRPPKKHEPYCICTPNLPFDLFISTAPALSGRIYKHLPSLIFFSLIPQFFLRDSQKMERYESMAVLSCSSFQKPVSSMIMTTWATFEKNARFQDMRAPLSLSQQACIQRHVSFSRLYSTTTISMEKRFGCSFLFRTPPTNILKASENMAMTVSSLLPKLVWINPIVCSEIDYHEAYEKIWSSPHTLYLHKIQVFSWPTDIDYKSPRRCNMLVFPPRIF